MSPETVGDARQPEGDGLALIAPLNRNYGSGCYRRAIRLVPTGSHLLEAALEDDAHAFALTLEHDGVRVTAIEGRAVRFPLSTCDGAVAPLRALVGALLGGTRPELNAHIDPRANCTHLHDLALLAVGHALRAEPECRYEICIPDAREGRTLATLERDGVRLLGWEMREGVIETPALYAGQAVLGGFSSWARANLEPRELEHALMLQRGYMVAMSRRYDMAAGGRQSALLHGMHAVCYSYSPGQVEHAYGIPGCRRDFTDAAGELLRWT
ncbi:MAG: DUF2889 domain-containing protein [Gammaproteobacteria bacterium]|nr:DUF2889 domain-containing protein [Gammaproteobacteria bacterium]